MFGEKLELCDILDKCQCKKKMKNAKYQLWTARKCHEPILFFFQHKWLVVKRYWKSLDWIMNIIFLILIILQSRLVVNAGERGCMGKNYICFARGA